MAKMILRELWSRWHVRRSSKKQLSWRRRLRRIACVSLRWLCTRMIHPKSYWNGDQGSALQMAVHQILSDRLVFDDLYILMILNVWDVLFFLVNVSSLASLCYVAVEVQWYLSLHDWYGLKKQWLELCFRSDSGKFDRSNAMRRVTFWWIYDAYLGFS